MPIDSNKEFTQLRAKLQLCNHFVDKLTKLFQKM